MECPMTLSHSVCYIHSARSSRGGVTSVSRSGNAPSNPTLTRTLLCVSAHPNTVAARLVREPSTVSSCTSSRISSGRSSATRSSVVAMFVARRDRTSLPISSIGLVGIAGEFPFLSTGFPMGVISFGTEISETTRFRCHPSRLARLRIVTSWGPKSLESAENASPASYRARTAFHLRGVNLVISPTI